MKTHNNTFDFNSNKIYEDLLDIITKANNTDFKPNFETNNHLNLYNTSIIKNIYISYPMNKLLTDYDYKISLNGYFFENEEWILKEKIITFNILDGFDLYLNQNSTDSIDLYFNKINPYASCSLFIDFKLYEQLNYDDIIKNEFYRIKCKNLGKMNFKYIDGIATKCIKDDKDDNKETLQFLGEQNKYLSESINENTINFSRISNVFLVTKNCSLGYLKQNIYIYYTYPDRKQLFV